MAAQLRLPCHAIHGVRGSDPVECRRRLSEEPTIRAGFLEELVVGENSAEGAAPMHLTAIVDVATFAEPIHEETHPGARRADHLG